MTEEMAQPLPKYSKAKDKKKSPSTRGKTQLRIPLFFLLSCNLFCISTAPEKKGRRPVSSSKRRSGADARISKLIILVFQEVLKSQFETQLIFDKMIQSFETTDFIREFRILPFDLLNLNSANFVLAGQCDWVVGGLR